MAEILDFVGLLLVLSQCGIMVYAKESGYGYVDFYVVTPIFSLFMLISCYRRSKFVYSSIFLVLTIVSALLIKFFWFL